MTVYRDSYGVLTFQPEPNAQVLRDWIRHRCSKCGSKLGCERHRCTGAVASESDGDRSNARSIESVQ